MHIRSLKRQMYRDIYQSPLVHLSKIIYRDGWEKRWRECQRTAERMAESRRRKRWEPVWWDRKSRDKEKGKSSKMRRWPSYPSPSLISGPWGTEAAQITGPQLLRNAASHSSLLVHRFCKITSSLWKHSSCENTSWLTSCQERPG